MDILTIIKSRRSIMPVQYNNESISVEVIMQLLEAANWAPTHRQTEPWRFKVIQGTSQEKLGLFLSHKYKETAVNFSKFKYKQIKEKPIKAGAVIAICMQRDRKESLPEWEEIAATAMAVQNMWLMATSLGIGGYWSSPDLIKYMDEFINLAEGERCIGLFYLGHYDMPPPNRVPRPIEEKVSWISG
jgi:nitroreductase